MNHIISNQFLDKIEKAIKNPNKKDTLEALEILDQVRDTGKIHSNLDPIEIGNLWKQECPSIMNFAQALLDKTAK